MYRGYKFYCLTYIFTVASISSWATEKAIAPTTTLSTSAEKTPPSNNTVEKPDSGPPKKEVPSNEGSTDLTSLLNDLIEPKKSVITPKEKPKNLPSNPNNKAKENKGSKPASGDQKENNPKPTESDAPVSDPRLIKLKEELLKLGQPSLDLDQSAPQNNDSKNGNQKKTDHPSKPEEPKFQELKSTRGTGTHPGAMDLEEQGKKTEGDAPIDPRVLMKPMMRGKDPSLYIRWSKREGDPVPLALVKDDKSFLIFFGEKARLKDPAIEEKVDGLNEISVVENNKQLVVKITPRPGLTPEIEHDQNGWFFRFKPQFLQPKTPINQILPKGPNDPFLFELKNRKVVIPYNLPSSHKDVVIVLTNVPGAGVSQSLFFPRFHLNKTGQGIVIEPLDPEIKVEQNDYEVSINHMSGLGISNEQTRFQNRSYVSFPSFFSAQAGPEWFKSLRFIRNRISAYLQRTDKGLDLIRYYLTIGLIPEANAFLMNTQQLNASILQDPRFMLMNALYKVLNLNAEDGYALLKDMGLDPQIELWRKIAKAMRILDFVNPTYEDLNKHDLLKLQSLKDEITKLPPPLQDIIVPLLSQAAADIKDKESARFFLDLNPRPKESLRAVSYDLAHAKVLFLEEKRDEAINILKKLAQLRTNLKIAVEASYEVIKNQYKNKEIDEKKAIEHLERLRFLWRGDLLEYRIVNRLAELYDTQNDLLQSVRLLKRLWDHFPQHGQRDQLKNKIVEKFSRIILENSDQFTPYQRVSVYEEFVSFTPDTKEGDKTILKIVEDLTSLDLLEKAGNLLSRYIETLRRERVNNPSEYKESDIHAFLLQAAEIQIDSDQYLDATATLERIVPEEADNKTIIRANQLRAYMNLKQGYYQEALDYVDKAKDFLSLEFKSQALMGLKDWNQSSNNFRELINTFDISTTIDTQAGIITDYALATALSGDPQELVVIQEKFGEFMEKTRFKDKFNFIVSLAPLDEEELAREPRLTQFAQVNELASFRKFMKTKSLSEESSGKS